MKTREELAGVVTSVTSLRRDRTTGVGGELLLYHLNFISGQNANSIQMNVAQAS